MIQYYWTLSMEWFPSVFPFWLFLVGASFGSFLNVVVYRLPLMMEERRRGERKTTLSFPPSTCPKCGHRIRPWENIPVLAWLMLRGRCSSCGNGISPRYPIVEFFAGLSFVLWIWVSPLFVDWLLLTLFSFFIVASVAWMTSRGK